MIIIITNVLFHKTEQLPLTDVEISTMEISYKQCRRQVCMTDGAYGCGVIPKEYQQSHVNYNILKQKARTKKGSQKIYKSSTDIFIAMTCIRLDIHIISQHENVTMLKQDITSNLQSTHK